VYATRAGGSDWDRESNQYRSWDRYVDPQSDRQKGLTCFTVERQRIAEEGRRTDRNALRELLVCARDSTPGAEELGSAKLSILWRASTRPKLGRSALEDHDRIARESVLVRADL
jgi:hypothetical protein